MVLSDPVGEVDKYGIVFGGGTLSFKTLSLESRRSWIEL